MRTFSVLAIASLMLALPASLVACGDDDPVSPTGGAGANNQGGGNTGGGTPSEFEELKGDITTNGTLTADKNWLLTGTVRVQSGATLTIEAGTTIYGDPNTKGTLVISQGGKIQAVGTADEPIVFTTASPVKQPGQWGGVVLLGKAPIVVDADGATGTKTAAVEGFTTDEIYGGNDPNDDSGTMQYVRIEYGGVEISDGNEINGLTMAGVGKGTTIDHIMVRYTLDDCFEWFGGTVDGSHLVCYNNGDDAFDMDEGYNGNLQFLFAKMDPTVADDSNGVEADSITANAVPADDTAPTIYNMTLCGQGMNSAKQQYGMLLREHFKGSIHNSIVVGFEAGVDIRDAETDVTMTHTMFFDMSVEPIAYAEDGSNEDTQKDDDAGFDEVAWFEAGAGNSADVDPMIDCFGATPNPVPTSNVTGATPPAGFDTSATFVGAFAAGDDWMDGAWVAF